METVCVAIVHEDDKPVRLFRDDACIFKAHKWAHRHYCLEDLNLPLHQLPDWLTVKFYLMAEAQIMELIK